jgi:transposase
LARRSPVILLETGPINRFADVGNFAPPARCVDSCAIARERRRQTQEGNKYLALGIRRGSEFAVSLCPEAWRFLERKQARTKDIVAIKVPASSGRARGVTL